MRIGRGVEQRHRAALGTPNSAACLAPDFVEDRLHVVHALLEREVLRAAVGHAGAALVEQDDAAERASRRKNALDRAIARSPRRWIQTRNKQQVERAVAKDLIGDVNVVALDVPSCWVFGHFLYAHSAQAAPDSYARRLMQEGYRLRILMPTITRALSIRARSIREIPSGSSVVRRRAAASGMFRPCSCPVKSWQGGNWDGLGHGVLLVALPSSASISARTRSMSVGHDERGARSGRVARWRHALTWPFREPRLDRAATG